MIKAILLDLDGTLLNDQKLISPQTKQTLLDLQDEGVKVFLASGRPKQGIEPFADELRLHEYGGLLVSSNGACVTDAERTRRCSNRPSIRTTRLPSWII